MGTNPASPSPVVFPAAYVEFFRLFNAREFWESHEVLEQPWRANRSDFYQGLIIYASAFVHAQRGNPIGVRKQMAKVFGKLEPFRPYYMGIDVDDLFARARQCKQLVAGDEPPRGPRLTSLIPYHRLRPDVHLVRGDEPELTSS